MQVTLASMSNTILDFGIDKVVRFLRRNRPHASRRHPAERYTAYAEQICKVAKEIGAMQSNSEQESMA